MIQRNVSSLRAGLASHEAGRGKRYPRELKARAIEYAEARRSGGVTWVQIARELGLAFRTIRQWCSGAEQKSSGARAMVPVRVIPDGEPREVAVVSPSGYRVEGLTLQQAVAALRVLG